MIRQNTQTLSPRNYFPPEQKTFEGRFCVIMPFDKNSHADSLYENLSLNNKEIDYRYVPYGPFYSKTEFLNWININCLGSDPLFYTVCVGKKMNPVGLISLLKIEPYHGKVELGFIHFSPLVQKTAVTTEGIYLIMKYVFEGLKFRRLEWKCDNNNTRSKTCATRLGFTFEGIFRQHWIIKSLNRDTAWYSIIDQEWPEINFKIKKWLSPDNFLKNNAQIKKLSDM